MRRAWSIFPIPLYPEEEKHRNTNWRCTAALLLTTIAVGVAETLQNLELLAADMQFGTRTQTEHVCGLSLKTHKPHSLLTSHSSVSVSLGWGARLGWMQLMEGAMFASGHSATICCFFT